MSTPQEATLDCPDYAIITMVQGSLGEPSITLGKKGQCRFCGQTDPRAFRSIAHTLPEAFGNKWVTSLDECDACNARFGAFDDALVKSMGAILTVGGTQGKGNKVRQTGRSDGPASIRHRTVDGQRSISMRGNGTPFSEHFGVNPNTGELVFRIPGGSERFVPAKAYKALVKMAVALLPEDELPNFTKIIGWLGAADSDLLPHMVVGISFSIIGNSPPLLAAALLRRTSASRDTPYMLFVTTMGSVYLQIVLKVDELDGDWPSRLRTRPNIRWTNTLAPPGEEPLALVYDDPIHLDWGRAELEAPVIEAIVTAVHPQRGQARISVVFRKSGIAPLPS
ncbi:HNH endonuclease [uncultured Sphingomonas sp.]|uniref:HNH endonuclease n=1 Tax=uncultured Sphingomonas sp. TaxID=158754 RepID=UPI0025FFB5C8|nr:HNH endonuclease [uncultured Sphingomonas sp.]